MPKTSNLFKGFKSFIVRHKIITLIVILVLAGVFYYGYNSIFGAKPKTTYVSSSVTKGTITTSVSGSGQVSNSSQINLQFKASGELTYLAVQNGQSVSAGQLIAEIDPTAAQQAIQNAQNSLQSSQISLQKLIGSDTTATPQNKQNAENTLSQDYQTGYNDISTTFTTLPAIMTGLNTILYGMSFNNYQQNVDYYTFSAYTFDNNSKQFGDSVAKSYQAATTVYNKNFLDYKNISRSSDNATISSMITETYNTIKDVSQAVKDANNLIQFYKDTLTKYNIKPSSQADADLANLNNYASQIDGNVNSLLNVQNSILSDTQAVSNASLDVQSAQLSLQQQQTSLDQSKQNLANYYIYAPFSGVIGNVAVQKFENVGSGTTVATLITTKKIATIPLNEVDVAKIQVGQKAVITFDALPDLTVAGQVAQIDPIGTVSQGVVTYSVQILFDTQDTRVKSGMSMSTNIITNVKQDVLLVPNAAVKTQGTTKYVQVLVNGAPQQKIITIGLSDDTNTEIASGLNEGDSVITQTINASATSTTAATTRTGGGSLIPGLGGGNVRFSGGGGGARGGN